MLLGSLLVALGLLGVGRSFAPIAFFGGRELAEKYTRLRALDREADVSVLALGPSFVDMGFDAELFTRLTGKRTYNIGASGTDIVLQSLLLRDVLIPRFQPEAILWGMREEPRVRSNINHQYLQSSALRSARGGPWVFDLASHLPQYQRRSLAGWRAEFLPLREPIDPFGQTEPPLLRRPALDDSLREGAGSDLHLELESRLARAEPEAPRFLERREYSVSEEFARATFEETLRFARERGIAIFFFQTPYHRNAFARDSFYSHEILTGVRAADRAWLLGTLAENGFPLINLRYCAGVSDESRNFYDGRHLNRVGAVPMTEILAEVFRSGTVPEAWRGCPSPAELEAIFGPYDRESVPVLEAGRRLPLWQASLVRDERRHAVDLYARLAVATPGRYRFVLVERSPPREREAAYYLRVGAGFFDVWEFCGRGEPLAIHPRVFTLEQGEVAVELHSGGTTGIDWKEFALLPESQAAELVGQ